MRSFGTPLQTNDRSLSASAPSCDWMRSIALISFSFSNLECFKVFHICRCSPAARLLLALAARRPQQRQLGATAARSARRCSRAASARALAGEALVQVSRHQAARSPARPPAGGVSRSRTARVDPARAGGPGRRRRASRAARRRRAWRSTLPAGEGGGMPRRARRAELHRQTRLRGSRQNRRAAPSWAPEPPADSRPETRKPRSAEVRVSTGRGPARTDPRAHAGERRSRPDRRSRTRSRCGPSGKARTPRPRAPTARDSRGSPIGRPAGGVGSKICQPTPGR